MAVRERFEFRIDEAAKSRVTAAAALAEEPVSEFVRTAAEARADAVLAEHRETRVPASFFDELLAALDQQAVPNAALRAAADHARRVISST